MSFDFGDSGLLQDATGITTPDERFFVAENPHDRVYHVIYRSDGFPELVATVWDVGYAHAIAKMLTALEARERQELVDESMD